MDSRRGLTTREADERRQVHGVNEIGVKKQDPLWKKYLEQFNQPFILLLLASAVISIIMDQKDDAASITFAIVIVVTVGFVQVRHFPRCTKISFKCYFFRFFRGKSIVC